MYNTKEGLQNNAISNELMDQF